MQRAPNRHIAEATLDLPPDRSPHFRRVPVAISLRVDAEVGRIDRNVRD